VSRVSAKGERDFGIEGECIIRASPECVHDEPGMIFHRLRDAGHFTGTMNLSKERNKVPARMSVHAKTTGGHAPAIRTTFDCQQIAPVHMHRLLDG
jgi:hypothetical protein